MQSDAITTFPRRHAATRRFTLGAPRSFRVSPDGERVLFLRSSGPTDPSNSLWVAEPGSGERLVFDASATDDTALSAAERARRERAREQAGGVVAYSADPALEHAYFVLGGQLHAVDVGSGDCRTMAAADVVFDPKPRPDSADVAYVSGAELRLTDGERDRPVPLPAGGPSVSWGSAEFVAAEEMGRSTGYWWSEDGNRLAVCRVDTSPVPEWWIASPDDPSTAPRTIRYPAAGEANADVGLWLVDPDEGPLVEVDWRRGEFEYLAAVSWTSRLLVAVQTRDQRTTCILAVDADTGEAEEQSRDTDEHWVELVSGVPLVVGESLVTVSDRGGSRRLLVNGQPVTPDTVQVRSVIGAHGDDAVVATIATEPKHSVVARIGLDGSIDRRWSDPDAYATATVGGGTTVITSAFADDATRSEIFFHDGGNDAVESFADEPGFDCTPSFHVVGARALESALCLPAGHDGSPLPVLLDPYGGPHAQRVVRSRNAFATSQWFAEQGFAVVVVDGRGTPARGPGFEREVWGDLATPVLDDQVDALHALAADRAELDLSRVGIRGWSFGGYLAALAVLRRPDVFHAAVAGAPVTDWRLYDTHYTERYLGHPDEYPEHYERTSLLHDAAALERPLMLIHGLADDNVVAAHTLQLSRALLEAGRPHTVLPLSGVTHMTPQEQVAENLLHLQRDFLLDALG